MVNNKQSISRQALHYVRQKRRQIGHFLLPKMIEIDRAELYKIYSSSESQAQLWLYNSDLEWPYLIMRVT